jgi:hypothetical protein
MGFVGKVREKSLLDPTALGQLTKAEVFECRNEFWVLQSAKYFCPLGSFQLFK